VQKAFVNHYAKEFPSVQKLEPSLAGYQECYVGKPFLTGWWGDFWGLLLVTLQGTFTWGLISFQPCNLGKNRNQWARAKIGEAPCQGKAAWSQHHQKLARPCIKAPYPTLKNLT
jgi:hypothetical protein